MALQLGGGQRRRRRTKSVGGRKSLSIHNYVNYKVTWKTTHAEIINGEN